MAFFRDNEVLGDVEAGEQLENLMEFSRFHGLQLELSLPSRCISSCPCCFFVVTWLVVFSFLKAPTTGHFKFIIKNVDPDLSVLKGVK